MEHDTIGQRFPLRQIPGFLLGWLIPYRPAGVNRIGRILLLDQVCPELAGALNEPMALNRRQLHRDLIQFALKLISLPVDIG